MQPIIDDYLEPRFRSKNKKVKNLHLFLTNFICFEHKIKQEADKNNE